MCVMALRYGSRFTALKRYISLFLPYYTPKTVTLSSHRVSVLKCLTAKNSKNSENLAGRPPRIWNILKINFLKILKISTAKFLENLEFSEYSENFLKILIV